MQAMHVAALLHLLAAFGGFNGSFVMKHILISRVLLSTRSNLNSEACEVGDPSGLLFCHHQLFLVESCCKKLRLPVRFFFGSARYIFSTFLCSIQQNMFRIVLCILSLKVKTSFKYFSSWIAASYALSSDHGAACMGYIVPLGQLEAIGPCRSFCQASSAAKPAIRSTSNAPNRSEPEIHMLGGSRPHI